MQTQTAPSERATPHQGFRGGDDGEHHCWRCSLKRALALGVVTAASSFVKDMSKSKLPFVENAFRVARITEKEIGAVADAVHDVVIFLDGFSGRSKMHDC